MRSNSGGGTVLFFLLPIAILRNTPSRMVLAIVKSALGLGNIHKLNAVNNLLAMFAALAFTGYSATPPDGRHWVLWVAVRRSAD